MGYLSGNDVSRIMRKLVRKTFQCSFSKQHIMYILFVILLLVLVLRFFSTPSIYSFFFFLLFVFFFCFFFLLFFIYLFVISFRLPFSCVAIQLRQSRLFCSVFFLLYEMKAVLILHSFIT